MSSLFMLESLPRGYSGLVWFLSLLYDWEFWWRSPNSVGYYRGLLHHLVWFVCFVEVFSVTLSCLICLDPSGRLHHWRACGHLSTRYASSGVLVRHVLVDTCYSGSLYFRLSNCLAFPRRLLNSAGLIFPP